MSEPIVSLETCGLRAGSLDHWKKANREMAKFVEANKPRAIAYTPTTMRAPRPASRTPSRLGVFWSFT